MEGDDTPGHHGLRTSYGSGTRSRRCIEPDEQRHAESDEKHEQERDTGRGSAFAGGIHMAGLHDHTEYEGRQQHLDMDTSLFAVKMFGDQINHLGYSENCNRIEEDGPPLLPQVIGIQLFPSEPQEQEHDKHDRKQLPSKAYHHDLQWNHQQNGIQIIENGQHLNLPVHPALLEIQRRQHGEQDTSGSGSGKTAEQQVLLPCAGIAPIPRRQQNEDIVKCDEQPRNGSRRHGNKIIRRIGAPAGFIYLKFSPHIYHDERQADIEEGSGDVPESGIPFAEQTGQHLRGRKAENQEQGKSKDFFIGSIGIISSRHRRLMSAISKGTARNFCKSNI